MRNRRGASAIEFALTLPVLIVIIAGITEYGWLLHQRAQLVRAVREGVRLAVVGPNSSNPVPSTTAVTRTRELLNEFAFDMSTASVTARMSNQHADAANTNDTISVTALVRYQPLMGGLVPSPRDIDASLVMMLQDAN